MRNDAKERNERKNWKLQGPDISKIICKNCIFRAKDRVIGKTTINGATLAVCRCYPNNNKPVQVLYECKDCDYHVAE